MTPALPRGLFERASASSSPVSLDAGFRIEFLGGFLSLAPAFFLGPVARIIFELALGCGFAVAQILFVVFLAAQRLYFLLLALLRLAHP